MSAPPVHAGPDLLDYLAAAEQVKDNPNVRRIAHTTTGFETNNGHFGVTLDTRPGDLCNADKVLLFVDMGDALDVVNCGSHGVLLTPEKARALGDALTAWADRRAAA